MADPILLPDCPELRERAYSAMTPRPRMPSTALRLPVPLVEALRAAADAEGKTLAGVLREAAEAWLKERGRWPPKAGG